MGTEDPELRVVVGEPCELLVELLDQGGDLVRRARFAERGAAVVVVLLLSDRGAERRQTMQEQQIKKSKLKIGRYMRDFTNAALRSMFLAFSAGPL